MCNKSVNLIGDTGVQKRYYILYDIIIRFVQKGDIVSSSILNNSELKKLHVRERKALFLKRERKINSNYVSIKKNLSLSLSFSLSLYFYLYL